MSEDADNTPQRLDVVNWHRQIVEKVVNRLIYQDQVIVPLINATKGAEENDPFIVVHPNFIQDS